MRIQGGFFFGGGGGGGGGGINKFISSRVVSSKKHLPWITKAIKREKSKRAILIRNSRPL